MHACRACSTYSKNTLGLKDSDEYILSKLQGETVTKYITSLKSILCSRGPVFKGVYNVSPAENTLKYRRYPLAFRIDQCQHMEGAIWRTVLTSKGRSKMKARARWTPAMPGQSGLLGRPVFGEVRRVWRAALADGRYLSRSSPGQPRLRAPLALSQSGRRRSCLLHLAADGPRAFPAVWPGSARGAAMLHRGSSFR